MEATLNKSTKKKSKRYRTGFTYSEVLVATIIISVLLVAALQLFGNLGRSTQHTFDQNTAENLTIEMIREIMTKHYEEPDDTPILGQEAGEIPDSRLNYDDVDDYDDWTSEPPQDRIGNTRLRHANLERKVTVGYVAANDFTQTVDTDQGFKRVVITIKRNDTLILKREYIISDAPIEIAGTETITEY